MRYGLWVKCSRTYLEIKTYTLNFASYERQKKMSFFLKLRKRAISFGGQVGEMCLLAKYKDQCLQHETWEQFKGDSYGSMSLNSIWINKIVTQLESCVKENFSLNGFAVFKITCYYYICTRNKTLYISSLGKNVSLKLSHLFKERKEINVRSASWSWKFWRLSITFFFRTRGK